MSNGFYHSLVKWGLGSAGLVLAGWALLTLRWQSDLLTLFPQDLPAVRELRELQGLSRQKFSLLAVVTAPGTATPLDIAARLDRAAAQLSASPLVAKTEVLADPTGLAPEAWAAVFIGLPPDKFARFAAAAKETAVRARLRASRQALAGWPDPAQWARVHYDPLDYAEWIIPSARAGTPPPVPNPILRITPATPADTPETAVPLVEAARRALAGAGFAPGAVALTGEAAYVAEIGSQMRREMIGMTVGSVVLIALVFWAVYRSWFPLVALLALQAAGLLAALVVARITWGRLDVLSVAFCAVALGICSDYGVVVYHYLINGGDRTDAAWRTLRRSVLYCVLTTVAGLGALAASALPGLRQFAVLIAVCLLVVAGLAVGPWARWVQRRITPRPPAPEPPPDRQTLPKAWQRAGWVYLVAGWALLAWAALHADRLYDFSWARLSPNNLEAQRGQAVLDAYVPGQFVTGDASNWAANRAVWRAHIPLALAPVFTQEDFQPALAQPYENLFHLLDRWSRGDRELEIWARGSTAFARLRAELPAMMRNNLVKVSAWSVMVILLLLGWGVGSVPMVLRTLLALAAGVGWWLAGLAALGEPLTLATLACLPIWFGLSEDFSIFLVLFLRAEGPQWGTARRRLGTPLALCAVTTVIGFGISGFSTQPVLRNFGVVLALGIASTFLAACVGLPALLVGTVPRPSHVSTFYTTFWFSLAERVAALTPRRVAQRVADWMGRAYALTHPGQSRIVRKNLRLLTGREPVPGAAANVCAHFARNLADYFYLGTRPLAAGVSLFVERRGYENLCRARAAGRGALLLTCHYGFFEGGGALMKQFDFPTVSLTAPEPSPSLTRWRARFRQRWGLDTLEIEPDPFFVLRLVEHLRENRFVAALIDRPFGPGFVEVQMPGGKLRVAGHIVLAAQAVRAPVLPMLIARRPDNLYRVWAGEPMEIEDQGGREATARYYAQRIMDCLQPELAQDAAQWTQFVSLSSPPS